MPPTFDDPQARWDAPPSRWSPSTFPPLNALLRRPAPAGVGLNTSLRGRLIAQGHVRPVVDPAVAGLAAPIPKDFT